MTAEEWARVTALFGAACERPPAERAAWLHAHCDDAATRDEVAAMLASYDTDPDFLEQPVDAGAGMAAGATGGLVGRRLGAYRLGAEIGRGGMGVVYQAHRDDQEFDRRAAIKVLPAWGGSEQAQRFRQERRVLAGLDHPGIARLLDSGTTDEGVPYFVMEFVDGQPIDVWCRRHNTTLRDRVSLIERVADALAYAHRHLVIHRDVKPANLLVTVEGQPKLLDFGIAALLRDDGTSSAGLTRTGHHSFTPEYASPEQVRGERVTTATDVYSLGVTAYLILAGRPPYTLAHLSPLDQLRTVCEVDPPLMSAAAGDGGVALRGDLDAVVAKALVKHPGQRYGTVAEFAADLRAWREGRAVSAAPQTFTYRARRFVSRNRKAMAAAAALLLALLGGGAATAWQARIAAAERDKAQNRFRQVQEFSRSLLFDVHEALRPLPGATEPRRLLLDRAVQFLDGLAADAGDDAALKLELSAGYHQLANVQGNTLSENVGDTAAAVASLKKALRLAQEVRTASPDAIEPLLRTLRAAGDLASVQTERGDAEARAAQDLHAALVVELERRDTSVVALRDVAKGYSDIGRLHVERDEFDQAEAAYRKAVATFRRLPRESRPLSDLRDHGYAMKRLGGVLMRTGRLDESEAAYQEALTLDEAAIRLDDRPQTRYDMTFTLSDLALVQSKRERWNEAVAQWTRALEIRQAVSAADPKNVRAVSGIATLHGRLGLAALNAKNFAAAATRYREELRLREELRRRRGDLPANRAERGWAALRLAEALSDGAAAEPRRPERSAWMAEARRLLEGVGRGDGKASVPAGSEPGFLELHDRLTARLASPGAS